jgi:hypothetical protein
LDNEHNSSKFLLQVMILVSSANTVDSVLFFLLGESPASEFYVPTFRNKLSVTSSYVCGVSYTTYEDGTDNLFRNVGT